MASKVQAPGARGGGRECNWETGGEGRKRGRHGNSLGGEVRVVQLFAAARFSKIKADEETELI